MSIVPRSLHHVTAKHQCPRPGRCRTLLVGNSSGVLVLVLVLRAGQDRVGQSYIQVVVVLDQGDIFVVEHEILEG